MLAKRLLKRRSNYKNNCKPKKVTRESFHGSDDKFSLTQMRYNKRPLCSLFRERSAWSLFFCFTSYASGRRSKCPCKTHELYRIN